MRRAFLHVDEFGETGMVYLPYAVCVSEPLVVWAPSASLLSATPGAFLRPCDLLALVDQADAPVRIIGRANWLCDAQSRRSHPWCHARWIEGFDDVIRRMAIEDQSRPLPSRRVIIDEAETGFARADEILAGQTGQTVARRLNDLFRKRLLPPGIWEKAARARERWRSAPRAILRDVYNHARAVDSAGAQLAITPSEHMAILQQVVPGGILPGILGSEEFAAGGRVSAADFREAIRVLQRVKPVLSMRELRKFLGSGLKAELHELIYAPHLQANLDSYLVQQVSEATKVEPLLRRLFSPHDPIALTLSTGGLVLGLLTYLLTHEPQWALISFSILASQPILRKYNLIPEAIRPGHSARSLFYLLFGTKRPKRHQIESLLSRLLNP